MGLQDLEKHALMTMGCHFGVGRRKLYEYLVTINDTRSEDILILWLRLNSALCEVIPTRMLRIWAVEYSCT